MFGTYTWVMNAAEKAAFEAGQEAYRMGLNAQANPYVSNTPLWKAWNDGLDSGAAVAGHYFSTQEEGSRAYDASIEKGHNPYLPSTSQWKSWQEGWETARFHEEESRVTEGPRLGEEVCHVESPF